MMTENHYLDYLGIDISKATLDVALYSSKKLFQVSNDDIGLCKLIDQLTPIGNVLVAIESTGKYGRKLRLALQATGVNVSEVNPRQVRDFAKANR